MNKNRLLSHALADDVISLISIHGRLSVISYLTTVMSTDPLTGQPAYRVEYALTGYVPVEQGKKFKERNHIA